HWVPLSFRQEVVRNAGFSGEMAQTPCRNRHAIWEIRAYIWVFNAPPGTCPEAVALAALAAIERRGSRGAGPAAVFTALVTAKALSPARARGSAAGETPPRIPAPACPGPRRTDALSPSPCPCAPPAPPLICKTKSSPPRSGLVQRPRSPAGA